MDFKRIYNIQKSQKTNELYKDDWPLFEKMLGEIRYRKIRQYVEENKVYCDIGCGYHGTFLRSVSKKIKYGYGFDWKVTPQKFDNIELINNRNMANIPLDKETCDGVFMLAVLEHLDDAEKMILDCRRILKPGGYWFLQRPRR